MRLPAVALLTTALLACGSSQPDVCQQDVALALAQNSKQASCVPDAGDGGDAGAVDFDGGLHSCEAAIKQCDGGDLAFLDEQLECRQTLASTYQCRWLTETDPQGDQSFYVYEQGEIACGAKVAKVSNPTCASALPPIP
jgi:hypothetical protein